MRLKLFLPFSILSLSALTAFASSEDIVQRHLTATGGGRLTVNVEFGSIEVTAGNDNEISIDADRKIDWGDEKAEKDYFSNVPVKISQQGNAITVEARREGGMSGYHRHGRTITDGRYVIRVPKNFNADLRTSGGEILVAKVNGEILTKTNGGDLKFTGLKGKLEGKTSGGSIEITDCEGQLKTSTSGGNIAANGGSGELDARTSGGSAEVKNFAGPAQIETSGGNLDFANIRGQLTARTSGGSIDATLASPIAGDVKLETSAGSISIAVPENAALQIDAAASAGNITSDLTLQSIHSSSDSLKATMNGGGPLLKLRSGGGSIRLSSAGKTASL